MFQFLSTHHKHTHTRTDLHFQYFLPNLCIYPFYIYKETSYLLKTIDIIKLKCYIKLYKSWCKNANKQNIHANTRAPSGKIPSKC